MEKIKLLPKTRQALKELARIHDKRLQVHDEFMKINEELDHASPLDKEKLREKYAALEQQLFIIVKQENDQSQIAVELCLDEYGLNSRHAKVKSGEVKGKRIYHHAHGFGSKIAIKNLTRGNFQPGHFRSNYAGFGSYWGDNNYFVCLPDDTIGATLSPEAKLHVIDAQEYQYSTFSDFKDIFDEDDFNLLDSLCNLMATRCFFEVAAGYDGCLVENYNDIDKVYVIYNREVLTLSKNPVVTREQFKKDKLNGNNDDEPPQR